MENSTGAFICQISDTDWSVSRVEGIYGNRKNKPDSGQPLRTQDQLSVIRDLISIRPGDFVFFHVIGKEFGVSALHGVYTPASQPYFDTARTWSNQEETFPFRFLFKPYPGYEPLCVSDMSIKVSDLYQAIERREIWSLATLENERNIERRAVRKIALSDAHTILDIFLREYKASGVDASPANSVSTSSDSVPLRTQITDVGRYENAVKAVLMDKLADRHDSVTALFPNYVDFMNETFVAPTTRKLMDVLVVSKRDDDYHYYVIEAKTSTFGLWELRQLMLYIDLFRQRPIFKPDRDKVSACALAATFDNDTRRFRDLHNSLSPHDPIILVQYEPVSLNKDAVFAEAPQMNVASPLNAAITPRPWETPSPLKDISDRADTDLPCFANNPYLIRSIVNQPSPNSFVIEEKSTVTNSRVSICYAFVWDRGMAASDFRVFLSTLYQRVAPLVSYNFRAINPVIVSRGYEPSVLNYIASYNDLSVRRPISVFQW